MKVLVTGAAGFIASRVVAQLVSAGHDVTGVDNFNDAYDVRLKRWRETQSPISIRMLDITNRDAVLALGRFDAIINLAARAGVPQSVANPWLYVDTNITGTLNLLELARQERIPKFVLASTSSLYGKDHALPFVESLSTDKPLSPYAASKKAAEAMCHTYHHLHGVDVSIVRYFTVFGPAGRPEMSLFRFVQWISEGRPVRLTGDGRQSRDFTYVDDIARGTIAALTPLGFEVINLGSDKPHVLADMIRMIEDRVGKHAKLSPQPTHPADVVATWANIDKAKRLLNWAPQTDAATGLTKMVEWYQHHREWAKDIITD